MPPAMRSPPRRPPRRAKPKARRQGRREDAKATDKPADKAADKPAAKADAAARASSSPMAELKKSNEKLDKILQKNRPNWSPEAELQRSEVRKLVGSFLDYGELAKRSLARHWDGLTAKQREEFVNTLRELVERSYLSRCTATPTTTSSTTRRRRRTARRRSPAC